MNNELFEKVEYLRAHSDIGYEEAASLLDRHDGDLTQAMIELERAHRVYGEAGRNENPWDNVFTRGKEHVRKHSQNPDNWFKKVTKAKLQVTREGENVADVPVLVPIIAAVAMPHVAIAGAVIGGLAGFRVKESKKTASEDDTEE